MQIMSVVLNVILLVGALVAIVFVLKGRQQEQYQSQLKEIDMGSVEAMYDDDIVAVRKTSEPSQQKIDKQQTTTEYAKPDNPLLMFYLTAKSGEHFVGYELLQALLSNGMRYGDMNLFHRHQEVSGKGPVLFSLANASEQGTFEIQKMGSFSTKGLCIFMHLSGNNHIDSDRLELMIQTATQLANDLNGHLLDDNQQPLTDNKLEALMQKMQPMEEAVVS